MQLFQPGCEYLELVNAQGLLEPGSDQYGILVIHFRGNIKEGREGDDVIPPENLLEFDQLIFGNECAAPCGPVVNTTDADGKAIGCWSYRKVGPIRTQFAADLVSDIKREDALRRRCGDAQRNRQDTQQLSPSAPRQGFKKDSNQHFQRKYFAAAPREDGAMRIVSPSTR